MPKIPLADIPNAPRAAESPLIQYPNYRVDFSGIADSLKQRGLPEAPFLAEAGAMGAIGQAIEQVGGVANQFAMQRLEAQNVIDVAKAENLMAEYSAKTQAEMQSLPPDQWDAHFSKGLPELQKQIDTLGVSPRAAEAITANYTRFAGKSRANIHFDAAKTAIEQGRMEVKVAMDRAFQEGDMEKYVRLGENAVKTGLMLGPEVEAGKFELEQKQKQEALQTAVLSNPFELQAEMEAAIDKDGETESFGKLKPTEVKRWLHASRQEARNQQIETRQDISNGIYSGAITDEKEIRDMAARAKLPEKEVASLARLLNREVQFNPELATKLKSEVMAYDAQNDPDMSAFNRINSEIESGLPKNEASALKSAIFQTWQQTVRDGKPKDKKQSFEAELMKEFDRLGDNGLLGKTGKDKEGKLVDMDAHMALWSDVETKKEKLRDWLRSNPDATPEQAKQQFMDVVGGAAAENASKTFDVLQTRTVQSNALASLQMNPAMPSGALKMSSTQKISDNLVNTVKKLEGFSENAFSDFKQSSVGYGTKAKTPNEKITEKEADKRLREELTIHADRIDNTASKLKLNLTQGQRDALVSFDFNTGKGAFLLETSGGDMNKVLERMKLYKNVTKNGKLVPLQGLVNRRAAEEQMFIQ